MNAAIDQKRLAKITALHHGAHSDFEDGVCAMEAAAYIANEPWSDHPECVCPVIAAFMRSWNDGLPDEERTSLLLPLIAKTIGTRGSKELEERRSLLAADWLVRVHTVAWLRLAKLDKQADLLASLPEITSLAQVPSIRALLEAVRDDAAAARDAARAAAWAAARAAARDAARDAAWEAAWAAAWDAAGAAAGAAAGDAARDAAETAAETAAWDAARVAAGAAARAAARAAAWTAAWEAAWAAARAAAGDAAWTAAWDAAWDAARVAAGAAARVAAGDALASTKKELQASAVKLIERMCALRDEAYL